MAESTQPNPTTMTGSAPIVQTSRLLTLPGGTLSPPSSLPSFSINPLTHYPEFRNLIYAHVIEGTTSYHMHRCHNTATLLLGMSQTSQQLRNETYALFADIREELKRAHRLKAAARVYAAEFLDKHPTGRIWL
jgi:hypothetical protein